MYVPKMNPMDIEVPMMLPIRYYRPKDSERDEMEYPRFETRRFRYEGERDEQGIPIYREIWKDDDSSGK
jgi:hypothetical protein